MEFAPGDALLFGPETRGLPSEILDSLGSDNKLRIPMADDSRSLNLSNAVAIAVYEAWSRFRSNSDPILKLYHRNLPRRRARKGY